MTPLRESEHPITIAEIQRAVAETITYWQIRGVRVVDVAPQFRCHRSWPAVRARMIEWLSA